MSGLSKRRLFVAALSAIIAIAAFACTPEAELISTGSPSPLDPSPTLTETPAPTNTPTLSPSPTASPTLPPHMECLSRYGYLSQAETWGEISGQQTADPASGEGTPEATATSSALNDGIEAEDPAAQGTPTIDVASTAEMDLTPTSADPLGYPTNYVLSLLFTPEVRVWSAEIYRWSGIYGLDPDLIATVMQIESCGHPTLVSPAGAIGLFQVMPFHFSYGEDPFDPDTNAMRGLPLLSRGLELSLGQTDLALAIYNGGTGVMLLDPQYWPSETRDYVTWGTGILADIKAGNPLSTSMQIWLEAGGDFMCLSSCLALVAPPRTGEP